MLGKKYFLSLEVRATIRSNNIFDIYPEKIAIAASGNSSQFVYPKGATQFGFNGRYIFGRKITWSKMHVSILLKHINHLLDNGIIFLN